MVTNSIFQGIANRIEREEKMNMTHPEILESYFTGGIERQEKPAATCFICLEKTDEYFEFNGKFTICRDCGIPKLRDVMDLLEEERSVNRELQRRLKDAK